jgi:hypothetical protein
MSNLTEIQRNQLERYENGSASGYRLLTASPREKRVFTALTCVFLAVLGVLVYAAAWTIDGWWDYVVIGDVIVVFFGIAAWVYPKRKNT